MELLRRNALEAVLQPSAKKDYGSVYGRQAVGFRFQFNWSHTNDLLPDTRWKSACSGWKAFSLKAVEHWDTVIWVNCNWDSRLQLTAHTNIWSQKLRWWLKFMMRNLSCQLSNWGDCLVIVPSESGDLRIFVASGILGIGRWHVRFNGSTLPPWRATLRVGTLAFKMSLMGLHRT